MTIINSNTPPVNNFLLSQKLHVNFKTNAPKCEFLCTFFNFFFLLNILKKSNKKIPMDIMVNYMNYDDKTL